MAAEVLRPHDCLLRSPNLRPCHPRGRPLRRPVDARKRRKDFATTVGTFFSGNVASGRVTGGVDRMDPAIEWLRPRQEVVRREIRLKPSAAKTTTGADEYAGTAFSMSPSPRKLPLPSLSWRKEEEGMASATRDLRRLLRLE